MTRNLTQLVLLLLLLIGMTGIITAQTEDEAAEELPEIPYYHSTLGFNVPEPAGWDDESTDEVALFTSSELDATIRVERADTVPSADAPLFEASVNLADGTWQGLIYREDDALVSSYTLVLPDSQHTIRYEDGAAAPDVFHLILTPDETDDIHTQIAAALAEIDIIGEVSAAGDAVEHEMPGFTWTELRYTAADETPVSVFYTTFNNAIHATVVSGDEEPSAEAADVFTSVFLGFFITLDTAPFLYLGLAATAIVFLLLIGSMYLRSRSASADLATLEQLAES